MDCEFQSSRFIFTFSNIYNLFIDTLPYTVKMKAVREFRLSITAINYPNALTGSEILFIRRD